MYPLHASAGVLVCSRVSSNLNESTLMISRMLSSFGMLLPSLECFVVTRMSGLVGEVATLVATSVPVIGTATDDALWCKFNE